MFFSSTFKVSHPIVANKPPTPTVQSHPPLRRLLRADFHQSGDARIVFSQAVPGHASGQRSGGLSGEAGQGSPLKLKAFEHGSQKEMANVPISLLFQD